MNRHMYRCIPFRDVVIITCNLLSNVSYLLHFYGKAKDSADITKPIVNYHLKVTRGGGISYKYISVF